MIEQDPVTSEDPVGFTVVNGVPVRGAFGGGVRGPWMEGSGFRLRRRSGSEHFRRSGLVVLDVRSTSGGDVGANSFEETKGSSGDDIGGVVRDLEGNSDVRLSGEIVNLVGENGVEPTTERGGVGEIGVVKLHTCFVSVVWVHIDVINSLSVEIGRTTDQTVNFIAFVEKEFR